MQCLDSDPKKLVDMMKHGIEYASGSKRIISRSSSISKHSDADSSFNRRDSKLREPKADNDFPNRDDSNTDVAIPIRMYSLKDKAESKSQTSKTETGDPTAPNP